MINRRTPSSWCLCHINPRRSCSPQRYSVYCNQIESTHHTPDNFLTDEELDELGDRVPPELLNKLEENEKLKELLYNKHLKDYLLMLNSHRNPERAMERAMKEPIFVEFADECLKVVEPNTEDKAG